MEKKNYQISIVVPVYKVEPYIHRCLDSILAQTFKDFELILVDDGSPDNCGAICDEYAEKDSRFHVIHKKNGGLSDARNAGLDWVFSNSKSEWITFLDSDDWIHPKYLELLINAVKDSGSCISICGFINTTGEEQKDNEKSSSYELVDTETFFCEHTLNAVIAWGKLYDKELFSDIRYPVGKLHEDEFTTYRLLFKTEKCAFVDRPLYYYYYNADSITKSEWHPKRLDVVEALFQSALFLKSNGYVKACIKQLKRQGKIILHNYEDQKVYYNNCVDNDCVRYLRKSMKRLLKMSKEFHLFSRKSYPLYYDLAYPTLNAVYKKAVSFKHRLRRIR